MYVIIGGGVVSAAYAARPQESMLTPETLAKMLLLRMHRAKHVNSEDLLED
jgi:hypothetical protein